MQKTATQPSVDALTPDACKRQLDVLRPQIGNYWWLWAILRLRSRQIKGFFPNRLFGKLLPLCRSSKPYFIGSMADGTRFVGDLHDRYSASCGMDRGYERELVNLLKGMADGHPG